MRQRRKELNISADQVAEKLGVSRSTVFRYENGDIEKMPIDILFPLAQVLKTTPSYLMGWEITGQGDEYSETEPDEDVDSQLILEARKKMSQKERDKMMAILRASFEEYF